MPTEAEIVKKAPRGTKLTATSLAAPEADWLKLMLYGLSGSGKTLAIVGLLEAGQKVFVASTDIGGHGLRSVKEMLRERGEEQLMANVFLFEFPNYGIWERWIEHPEIMEIDGKSFWEWNPDLFFWDGFANWQERHLSDKILDAGPLIGDDKTAHPLYEQGLAMDRPGFGALRKRTLRDLDIFLLLHNPNGKKIHKVITVLQNDGTKEDNFSGESKVGPLVIGAAYSYMTAAFDLVIQCTVTNKLEGTKKVPHFAYKCEIGGASTAKRRGLPVNPIETADMKNLWQKITTRPAEKSV